MPAPVEPDSRGLVSGLIIKMLDMWAGANAFEVLGCIVNMDDID